jgi:hypothetical protein
VDGECDCGAGCGDGGVVGVADLGLVPLVDAFACRSIDGAVD